jgi:acyl-CoA reductase-like NAD-dependent aldehyde dehydrogenase
MPALDAFYLPPELAGSVETSVQRFGPPGDSIEIRLPLVTPEDLDRWIRHLAAARAKHLVPRPAAATIRSVDRVAQRFLDPRSRQRREAIEAISGAGSFSAPMVAQALDDAFEPLVRGGLTRWLAAELGSASALDRPMPGPGGVRRRAHGPEWMLQVYAGNVPTVPVWPLVSALLLKSAVLAKTAAQEPLLAPLVARAIAENDPDLGACMAIVWWKGGQAELDRAALGRAPAVLAFGGDAAMTSIANAVRPGTTLVLHGPKVSVGYIGAGAMRRGSLAALAARAAHDVALYDQQGCLSPHAFYVERGGMVGPLAFAEALGSALQEAGRRLPRRALDAPESASVQMSRAQAALEAATGRVSGVLESSGGTEWTVISEGSPRFEPGPAHRVVRVHAVADVEAFALALRGSERYVEAIALEERGARRERLESRLAELGIPRITSIGSLQRPSPLGAHGGVPRLLPFVRWTTVEKGAAPAKKSKAPASKPSRRGSRTGGSRSRR